MNAEFLKALPSLLNRYLCTTAFAGLIVYSAFNIDPVTRYLADRFESLREVKVPGADLTFDAQDIREDARLFDVGTLTRESSSAIAEKIKALDARLMERLIFVESLKDLCKYDTRDWKAEEAAALDDHLADLGLATIEDDAETKRLVDERIRTHDRYAPSKELGAPLHCYKVALTAEGANVRNVLVAKMVQEATRRTPDEATDQPAGKVTLTAEGANVSNALLSKFAQETVQRTPNDPASRPASAETAAAPSLAATTAKPARAAGPKIAMRQR